MEQSTLAQSQPELLQSRMPTTPKLIEPSTMSALEGDYQLVAIEPEELGTVWDILQPMMFSVVERSNGRQTMETLIASIVNRDVALWGVVSGELRAIVGTQIVVESSGLRTLAIRFTVGKGIHEWIGLLDDLEEYARSQGCERIEAWARKGWRKLMPDYKQTHVLMERDL